MSKRIYEDDDGRTIANMNVDGMPWYMDAEAKTPGEKIQLSKAESRAAMWGALKATLLVVAIFAGAFALFILFCDNIWFK